MLTGITDLLRGINGHFELNRVVGFLGGVVYVFAGNFFVWYETVWQGKGFDITAYCLAFPGGLAVIVGGTAGAVAWKDKGVAAARVTEATGSKPAEPPQPAPQVQPELAAAVRAAERPEPVEEANL